MRYIVQERDEEWETVATFTNPEDAKAYAEECASGFGGKYCDYRVGVLRFEEGHIWLNKRGLQKEGDADA